LLCPQYREVDHIDRDGLNNRKSNLREGAEINARNQGIRKDNTSGFKGVSWHEDGKYGKWRAEIQVNGKQHRFGHFDDKDGAARAYDAAVREYFPPGAYLNFP
jgi:hypothetical protein